ncbi:hypothetical protein Tco_1559308, partial [Tanacetum coccineum]
MHAVLPPMTGNYMPSEPDVEIDYSQFTYGPKQTQPSESETQASEFDTCESNISTETPELVSEPVVNESNVACQPKVWYDAPIIEEYETDSEDDSLGFRESLGRALDGTEALMFSTLFILWLATVNTDSVELVPMGKVSTAIETLKKNTAKAEPSVYKDPLFNEITEDTLDYMKTEDAQDLGRTRDVVEEEKENAEDVLSTAQQKVSTDKEKVSTDKPKVSTDGSKVSTDKEKDSTDRTDEGTDDQTKGRRATQTTQTTTSTMF